MSMSRIAARDHTEFRMRLMMLALIVLLAGCALSPQTVTLVPALTVQAENLGQGRTVKVLATDGRSDSLVGTRGGVYPTTSEIRSDNDVAEAIRAQLAAGLVQQGYVTAGNEAEITLRAKLLDVHYRVPEGTVATSADIGVAIEIRAERAGRSHTANYRSDVQRRFPVAPTPEQNGIWLNELLSETLSRFFADTAMREFLSRAP